MEFISGNVMNLTPLFSQIPTAQNGSRVWSLRHPTAFHGEVWPRALGQCSALRGSFQVRIPMRGEMRAEILSATERCKSVASMGRFESLLFAKVQW